MPGAARCSFAGLLKRYSGALKFAAPGEATAYSDAKTAVARAVKKFWRVPPARVVYWRCSKVLDSIS